MSALKGTWVKFSEDRLSLLRNNSSVVVIDTGPIRHSCEGLAAVHPRLDNFFLPRHPDCGAPPACPA